MIGINSIIVELYQNLKKVLLQRRTSEVIMIYRTSNLYFEEAEQAAQRIEELKEQEIEYLESLQKQSGKREVRIFGMYSHYDQASETRKRL